MFQRRLYSGCSMRRMFGSSAMRRMRRSTSSRYAAGQWRGSSVMGVEPCRSNQVVCTSPAAMRRASTISKARSPSSSPLRRNGVHGLALRQAHGGGAASCRPLHEAEGFVDLPIQLLLPGDELPPLAGGLGRGRSPARCASPRSRGRSNSPAWPPATGPAGPCWFDERGRKLRWLACGDGKLAEFCAVES